jgi:hypothetical protein
VEVVFLHNPKQFFDPSISQNLRKISIAPKANEFLTAYLKKFSFFRRIQDQSKVLALFNSGHLKLEELQKDEVLNISG